MIQVEVPYGEVCPNKNIKVEYDVCKECGRYKSLSKTFVTCHVNNQTLQMIEEEKINKIVELIHQDLENHLQEYDFDYTENLHEAIKNRLDDIAETQYRKYLGKLW